MTVDLLQQLKGSAWEDEEVRVLEIGAHIGQNRSLRVSEFEGGAVTVKLGRRAESNSWDVITDMRRR
eukprot:3134281-Rhodomonas_salina.1